jgi:hypothetical protein
MTERPEPFSLAHMGRRLARRSNWEQTVKAPSYVAAKSALVSVIAVAALAVPGAAADKPNFSGDWKMNAAKSNFGPIPGPASIVRKVTHAEPSLAIVEEQQGDMGTQVTTRKYTTDGKEITFESGGAVVRGTAVWEGNTLILTSIVDAISVTFTDRMSLSADGRTLTSAVHIASAQGDLDLVVAFDKQ